MRISGVLRRMLLMVVALVAVDALTQSRKKEAAQQAPPEPSLEPQEPRSGETKRFHAE